MPRLASLLVASGGLLWGMLSGGCRPGPGTSCDAGEARCSAPDRQLVCQDGRFVETACRGPGGCALTPGGISCDISKNRPGDSCAESEEGAAACSAPDRMVVCRAGSYGVDWCRGPDGCRKVGGHAVCDRSVAKADEECHRPGERACSHDRTRLLACRGGKMVPTLSCRGENGCQVKNGKLECDLSVAAEGDPCEATMEGNHACAADGRSIVVCKGGKFIVDRSCATAERCSNDASGIACKKAKS